MFMRRITTRLRQQDWLAVTIEFARKMEKCEKWGRR